MKRLAKSLALGVAVSLSTPCSADSASGTGFAVTTSKLVTNYHVVKGCSDVAVITAKGFRKAKVLAFDEDADLALLHSLGISSAVAPLRQLEPRLGEWIGVFGFPLTDTLTVTGNFTDGVVSALRGISEDATIIQFTAPIQPGNSGGPLLDNSGNVIGVVVAKLNALKKAKETGDIPQNVNFAVSPDLLKAFLSENKVSFGLGNSNKTLGGQRIAAAAKDFTYRLICEPSSNKAVAQARPSAPSENFDKPLATAPVEKPHAPSQQDPQVGESRQTSVPRLTFNWDAPYNDTGRYTRYMGFHILHPYKPVLLKQGSLIIQLRRCLFTDSRTHFQGMEDAGGGWWRSCQADRNSSINLDDYMKAKTTTVSVKVDQLATPDVIVKVNPRDEIIQIPLSNFSGRLADLYRETRGEKKMRVSVELSDDWLYIPNQKFSGWVSED